VHELSICSAIADTVGSHAGGRRVAVVHLEVGHLRQVVPDTLRYSWDVVVTDTFLEGSVLDIREVPAVIECRDCGGRTQLRTPVFRCPCGSVQVSVVSGQELRIMSLDLHPPDLHPPVDAPAPTDRPA
jgi:hydrogenase nickel incorporation protein HypA/HybF